MKANVSIATTIKKLESIFSKFNEHFFNSELKDVVITASTDCKTGSNGWCTTWRVWQENSETHKYDDSKGYYEINICAEYLSRPFLEICETLLHEMTHLFNIQHGVQDTSRSGLYHNKKFKKAAESHGLVVEQSERYGFSLTSLSIQSEEWIKANCLDEGDFSIHRHIDEKTIKSKQSGRKYVCPLCGTSVRATKNVNIICGDCNVSFIKE